MSQATAETSNKPQMLDIALHPCTSSQFVEVGYSHAHQAVAIRFRHGGPIYQYPGVTPEDWAAFDKADSKGSYFIKHWKRRPFNKFTPDQA